MNKKETFAAGKLAAIQAAGNKARLADLVGVSRQCVGQWSRVPAERVLQIERLTGVSRTILRPDLYPDEAAP